MPVNLHSGWGNWRKGEEISIPDLTSQVQRGPSGSSPSCQNGAGMSREGKHVAELWFSAESLRAWQNPCRSEPRGRAQPSLSLSLSLSLLYLFVSVSFSLSPAFGKLAENPHILPSTPTKTELKILKSKVQNDRRGAILHVKIWLKNSAVFNPLVLILCTCLRAAQRRKLVFYFLNLKTCVWLPLRDPRLCFMGSLISTLSGWRDIFSPPHTWNTREAYINERLKRTQGSLAAILKHL